MRPRYAAWRYHRLWLADLQVGSAEWAESKSHDLFQPSDKITIFLFQLCYPLCGGSQVAFEIGKPPPGGRRRLIRIWRTSRREGGGNRRQIDFCQGPRRCWLFAAPWRARTVEGVDGRKLHAFEQPMAGRPQIPLALPQPWQLSKDAPPLLPVGLTLDPGADRLAVLARGQFHRDQDVGLRQHVLVDDRRPLRDQPRDKASHAAAAHDLLDMTEQAFPAFDRPLRCPQIRLVENQVQRFLIGLVDRFGKGRHEAAARRVAAEFGQVDDRGQRLLGY